MTSYVGDCLETNIGLRDKTKKSVLWHIGNNNNSNNNNNNNNNSNNNNKSHSTNINNNITNTTNNIMIGMDMLKASGIPIYTIVPHRFKKTIKDLFFCFHFRKPDKGLSFLIDHGFVEGSPPSVAKFFIMRKGLSKQMIGEFLGNLQNQFNMEVLRLVPYGSAETLTDPPKI